MTKNTFASFWHGGQLSPYEHACVSSFTSRGYEFTIYSYKPISGLPPAVLNRDAAEILPADTLSSFIVNGSPSITAFSDYFRVMLFQKTDHIWSDVDIVLLKEANFRVNSNVIGYEQVGAYNGAILCLDRTNEHFPELIRRIEAFKNKNMIWGDIGPRLLTEIYGRDLANDALPSSVFYPIHYNEYYKFLLPEYLNECAELCKNATTLHLWNNIIDKNGIWKEIGPPEGSFLHHAFKNAGALNLFKAFYPEKTMRTLIRNYLAAEGADLGIMRLAKQIVPSLKLTIQRHVMKQDVSIFDIKGLHKNITHKA